MCEWSVSSTIVAFKLGQVSTQLPTNTRIFEFIKSTNGNILEQAKNAHEWTIEVMYKSSNNKTSKSNYLAQLSKRKSELEDSKSLLVSFYNNIKALNTSFLKEVFPYTYSNGKLIFQTLINIDSIKQLVSHMESQSNYSQFDIQLTGPQPIHSYKLNSIQDVRQE